mgnify:FL=1
MTTKKEKRKVKEQCFLDNLEESINNVEMITNHIDKIYLSMEKIGLDYVQQDLEESYFDLEIALALMAILLRKMSENNYIMIPEHLRVDINALIHSAKFIYDTNEEMIKVYSRKGEEEIHLIELLKFAKSVIQ